MVPRALDVFAVLTPFAIRVDRLPVALQFIFQEAVPVRMALAVMRARAITKTVGGLGFIKRGLAARRNGFVAGGLFHGVGGLLVGIGLFAAEIVLGLVPIAL